ncbi:DEAD/DEAH box helicase [Sphingomonas oligophenolica]|uniref:RNA helicase n=1 Tax=Sphingomonas oligophenolica TaxID=301154 RepID=A0A502CH69_9SPHN|nr:DEAD/DEAH box helicase family protein [Sphingomonas oligophenolica]TPG13065.1 RNA helicase [Sphingomonas oligophenolica]
MSEIMLRAWQSEATTKALKWLVEDKTDRHFLINAAPGAGKTICASVIAKRLIEQGQIKRVIVIAPRSEVVRQWGEEYKFVTGRHMTKVTGADGDVTDFGMDLCATWAAIQSLQEAFQAVCRQANTLVICDEHHHAAVEAAWGSKANDAFHEAKFVLVLTGTPIRSDGKETIWFAFDDDGRIDHPEAGTYNLGYGEAVELNYCRPITFHRHEGRFSVKLSDTEAVAVSGTVATDLDPSLKRVSGLQKALDYYRLVCTPKYLDDMTTPDADSYQGTMLEWGIAKLDDLRETVPHAGGLVIAPSIGVAQYMAELLEKLDGEKPILVHSQMPNAEARIAAFKNSNKRWIVSVAMISEGVDIKRLRLLIYLPNAKTELAFRQAMGRVVRTLGPDDYSRAYVVMPTLGVFEEYARRVEREMALAGVRPEINNDTKICGTCGSENDKSAVECVSCGAGFPKRKHRYVACPDCGGLNRAGAPKCDHCGTNLKTSYDITLNEALRMGAIVRGMDLEEDEVRDAENNKKQILRDVLASGDDVIIRALKQLPEESYGRLRKIMKLDE